MDIPIAYVRIEEDLKDIEWLIEKDDVLDEDNESLQALSNYLTSVDELKYYLRKSLKRRQKISVES